MNCEYCNKKLPEIIGGGRDICKCKKAQKEWGLNLRLQILKKQLSQVNKELSELKDKSKEEKKK